MHLGTATWPDLADAAADLLLLPLGSCEQHGPHLPFLTDARVGAAVAERAAARLREHGVAAVSAPAVSYGASGEHQQFPGTLSLGHKALARVLLELGRSASNWCDRLVFVNAHGGNLPTVAYAAQRLRHEGRDAAWVPCQPPGADAHAGRTETSLMLALEPGSVRRDRARPGVTAPIAELLPRLRAEGVVAVSPTGVLGDPTGATAEEGEALLSDLVDTVVACVEHGAVEATGRLSAPAPSRSA